MPLVGETDAFVVEDGKEIVAAEHLASAGLSFIRAAAPMTVTLPKEGVYLVDPRGVVREIAKDVEGFPYFDAEATWVKEVDAEREAQQSGGQIVATGGTLPTPRVAFNFAMSRESHSFLHAAVRDPFAEMSKAALRGVCRVCRMLMVAY